MPQHRPSTAYNHRDRHQRHIYIRASYGVYQRIRTAIGWVLILLFLLLPWLDYQGRQAILLDINAQQFHFFATTLWPQDLTLLASLFISAAFGLFFITTFLGRVWCGYFCPQTVWTFLYLWFEEKLEGAANKRRAQDSKPLTPTLWLKKALKHVIWLSIAAITALTVVGYFAPIKSVLHDLVHLNVGFAVGGWLLFFTACTYINAGWMRRIICIHICPYARFQSAMLDKDTYIVGYNSKRGEPRGPKNRNPIQSNAPQGDCIDCNLCVQVCPTAIDIRNGLQYECINCAACIDACDNVMVKMQRPARLISYTTAHQLAGQKQGVLRPKLLAYGAMLLITLGLISYMLANFNPIHLDAIRNHQQLPFINNDGLIENSYLLKIINKSQQIEQVKLTVSGIDAITWYGPTKVQLQPNRVYSLPISLGVDAAHITAPITTIEFQLERSNKPNQPTHTPSRFIAQPIQH